jgi:hypothetical protein
MALLLFRKDAMSNHLHRGRRPGKNTAEEEL